MNCHRAARTLGFAAIEDYLASTLFRKNADKLQKLGSRHILFIGGAVNEDKIDLPPDLGYNLLK